jgi:uncharacterized membrane protein (UPF0127 family)
MKLKKKHLLIILVLAVIFFVGIFLGIRFFSNRNPQKVLSVNGSRITAEVVASQHKLELGLGGRSELCRDCGMLFIFSKPGIYPFWMKGMEFGLDIIWIRDNKIVHIEKNIPADFRGILVSQESADHVLEISSGSADRMNLKEGDEIRGY